MQIAGIYEQTWYVHILHIEKLGTVSGKRWCMTQIFTYAESRTCKTAAMECIPNYLNTQGMEVSK